MEEFAQWAVVVFGVAIIGACLWAIVVPEFIVKLATDLFASGSGMSVAVSVRVVLGVCLLVAAPASRFPLIFQVIGGLSLFAAVALPIVGRRRIMEMLGWFEQLPALALRCWLVVGSAFGAFLVVGAGA